MPGGEIHLDFLETTFSFNILFDSDDTAQTGPVNTFHFTENDIRASIKNFTNRIFSLNKRGRSRREQQTD